MTKSLNAKTLIIGSALLVVPVASMGQTSTSGGTTTTSTTSASVPTDRLTDKFSDLAGSQSNANALVTGLRTGSDITLTSTDENGATSTVTITNPTSAMGYGNVNISLSLAEALLSKNGITDPTAADLQAALTGGTVTTSSNDTVQLAGILTLRAQGEGWGEIANSLGFKLGEVVRSPRANTAESTERTEGTNRPERVAGQTERPDDSIQRPERVERPERIERPEMPERPERPEMPERPERPDH